MTAFVNKWQTVLMTSWKWQLLVGTIALVLLLAVVLLVRRWRRKRRDAANSGLMFGAPDEAAEPVPVSFRDDWADAYVEGPSVLAGDEAGQPYEAPTERDKAWDMSPAADAAMPSEPATDAWLGAATEPEPESGARSAWEDTTDGPEDSVAHPAKTVPQPTPPSGEVEQRVAKLEAAIVALTDLLRPAPAPATDATVGERLDALEQTISRRFDALARTLTNLPPGAALPGATADPEAVAAAVIEIRRTLKG